MVNTNNSSDTRSLVLDQMIRDEKASFPPNSKGDDSIIDFIMGNADLVLTAEQIDYLLLHSFPPFNPDREDYFDVLDRMISESKNLGNTDRVKHIYITIPFYPEDKDFERKMEFLQSGIQYFLSLGLSQDVGELYIKLVQTYVSIKERIEFCEQALGYLDKSSKEYACGLAIRKMLHHMECHKNEDYLHYYTFGETIFRKGESIFISPMFPYFAFREKAEPLYSSPTVLKGERGYPESLSLNSYGYQNEDKIIIDRSLTVGASNRHYEEYELIRHPDEKVICQADGKEYVCYVFSYGRPERMGERIIGDTSEKNYFAPGIGLVRTVLSVDNKKYVYELCNYSIKGGDGLLPLCVGNRWNYRQVGCPEEIGQVIDREIIAQNGNEYLLSGWDHAGKQQ